MASPCFEQTTLGPTPQWGTMGPHVQICGIGPIGKSLSSLARVGRVVKELSNHTFTIFFPR